jgi:hypothetical protein
MNSLTYIRRVFYCIFVIALSYDFYLYDKFQPSASEKFETVEIKTGLYTIRAYAGAGDTLSMLDGQNIYCSVSYRNTERSCPIQYKNSIVEVEFYEIDTADGKKRKVVKKIQNANIKYYRSTEQIHEEWETQSRFTIFDVIVLYSTILVFIYAIIKYCKQ